MGNLATIVAADVGWGICCCCWACWANRVDWGRGCNWFNPRGIVLNLVVVVCGSCLKVCIGVETWGRGWVGKLGVVDVKGSGVVGNWGCWEVCCEWGVL